jgi:hypothetical protein
MHSIKHMVDRFKEFIIRVKRTEKVRKDLA